MHGREQIPQCLEIVSGCQQTAGQLDLVVTFGPAHLRPPPREHHIGIGDRMKAARLLPAPDQHRTGIPPRQQQEQQEDEQPGAVQQDQPVVAGVPFAPGQQTKTPDGVGIMFDDAKPHAQAGWR